MGAPEKQNNNGAPDAGSLISPFQVGAFAGLRSGILRVQFDNNATRGERSYASAVAGCIAGGGITWAMHRRFIPGAVIFSLAGYLGQNTYNVLDDWQLKQREKAPNAKPLGERIMESRWMPMKRLSDQQYVEMLNDKLLVIDAEIALLDERIEEIRKTGAGGEGETQ
ncbi:hypothetical protein AJ80_08523 [Polytolypa hystricis UAMH7299]|uniref:Uncharacterized protein n=1 Tax=Polytolypa hystricis (strain UAMH7299) TaxID=1447883 RepID=A0A2B7X6P5_POLH7|nr:hypothetical protein AJ80_08523 [Polytolypa hystricis UAMH7299]